MKKNVSGVMLLTVSSFIIKIFGFVFRIYLTNIIGAEGAGLYQLILSVYALGASAAVSGIGTAVSALVGAEPQNSSSTLKTALIISLSTGFAAFLFVFFKTGLICSLIGEPRAAGPIKIISLCFPFTALFAALSGYFNGKCDVSYPVSGQIIEQMIRIGIIFIFAAPAAKSGIAAACAVTSAAITAAEALSAVYLAIVFYKKRPRRLKQARLCPKKLASFGIPAAMSSWIGSLIHSYESVLIPRRFLRAGLSHGGAVAALGVIKGMAMPLVLLPNILMTALSTVMLPSVSYAREHGRMFKVERSVSGLFRLCFVGGFFFAVVFFCFGEELCFFIYHNRNAGALLELLGFVSPFLYVNILSSGILCGLGKQKRSLLIGTAEGILKIIAMFFLIPGYGLFGYGISVIAGSACACFRNIAEISACCGKSVCPANAVILPAAAAAAACASSFLFSGVFGPAAAFFVYFIMLLLLKCVGTGDLKRLKNNIG